MSPSFSVDNFAAGCIYIYIYTHTHIYLYICKLVSLHSSPFIGISWDTVNSLSLCTYWQLIT